MNTLANIPLDTAVHFTPDPHDTKPLRHAFGQFATGVTIVTCCYNQRPVGMTANSFASVSLDPALLLWCIAKDSTRYSAFIQAEHFAIHVLPHSAKELCMAFAQSADAFDRCTWQEDSVGVPLLQEYISRFECTVDAQHDAGDHTIIIGKIHRVSQQPDTPLVFVQGRFD